MMRWPFAASLILTLTVTGMSSAAARETHPSSCAGLAPGQHSITIQSSGSSREVPVFVPGRGRLPLVIDLHGSNSNGAQQAQVSGFNAVAARHGFVVAHPSGAISFADAPGQHFWNIPGVPLATSNGKPPESAADDVQFISDLIDQLVAQACINPQRVYVTGMSGGGRMTSLLACRLSTRIAAIAPVAGLRAGLPAKGDPAQPDAASCQPQRAMPIVTFHGTDDVVNPYRGGGTPYWQYSIPVALQRWAELDHCQQPPTERRISAHVMAVHYPRCAQQSELLLYRIEASGAQGGGHSWPGMTLSAELAATVPPDQLRTNMPSTEINASELIWKFFSKHQLPSPVR